MNRPDDKFKKFLFEKFNKFKTSPVVMGLQDYPIPSSRAFIEKIYVNNEKVLKEITNLLNKENQFSGLLKRYNFLNENILKSIEWNVLDYKIPDYFFIPKDNSVKINTFTIGFKESKYILG